MSGAGRSNSFKSRNSRADAETPAVGVVHRHADLQDLQRSGVRELHQPQKLAGIAHLAADAAGMRMKRRTHPHKRHVQALEQSTSLTGSFLDFRDSTGRVPEGDRHGYAFRKTAPVKALDAGTPLRRRPPLPGSVSQDRSRFKVPQRRPPQVDQIWSETIASRAESKQVASCLTGSPLEGKWSRQLCSRDRSGKQGAWMRMAPSTNCSSSRGRAMRVVVPRCFKVPSFIAWPTSGAQKTRQQGEDWPMPEPLWPMRKHHGLDVPSPASNS